jgi:uncharacterized protein YndB with AHSA1/START domain
MSDLDLVLTRVLRAPRRSVWRCWTEAEHAKPWFIPKPHHVAEMVMDPRPGGRFFTLMVVDGKEYPNDGCYLEVVPEERLVFTDLIGADWWPLVPPDLGFTAILTVADHPDGTLYTATARHGSAEAARRHAAMGFHEGWGTVAAQLEDYAARL